MSVDAERVYPWEFAELDGGYELAGRGTASDSDHAGHTCVGGE